MSNAIVTVRGIGSFAVIALAALALCGCGNEMLYTIKPGRYISEPTGEWIEVKPKTVILHLNVGVDGAVFVTREYSYWTDEQGTEMVPYGGGSTNDLVYGTGRFDFGLRDNTIVKKDGRTGKTLAVFKLEK